LGGFKEWADGWAEEWVDGWAEELVGGGMGGQMGGRRERARGEYRFSSIVKQKKKEKIYAVFYFTGKRFFFYIYDVITWEK
jgi:hypothetical protein